MLGSHRYLMTPPDGRDEEHIRRVHIHLEPIADALSEDARSERSKAFAELDFDVHLRLHARAARVTEDATRPERTGPELPFDR